ncbi:MAG: Uma2 family endonuclease [Anaerolineae bacterium]
MAVQERLYSVEDFEAFLEQPENKERLFELIDGRIVEKVPTQEHAQIVMNIGTPLNLYAHKTKSGRVGTEARHRNPQDSRNSRQPDISFDSHKQPLVKQGAVLHMPTLAVEVKSPSDTYIEMREKASYYLANGAQMVWLVFPEKRIVEVYTVDADVQILLEDETISGGEVLPGFELAVHDVFVDPLAD